MQGCKETSGSKWLKFDHYEDCLFNGTVYNTKYNMLRARKHDLTTETVTKIALSASDDKRFLYIHTYINFI